jgi:autophagy-related protein 5
MADDYEVTRTIWDAKVPMEFSLDSSEFVMQSAQSFYTMLSRVSYFPLCMAKVLQFFSNSVDEVDDIKDAWLQSGSATLKWHYPIGVLYDLHVEESSTPWHVTLHLKNFPNELIRANKDAMRNCFLQSIKEADYLKHKGKVMEAMHPDEHARLFESLGNDRFDDFWSVNRKLMADGENGLLNIPMRFYEMGKPFRQLLVQPLRNEKETTLEDALADAFPDWRSDTSAILTAISHGIVLPLDTPNIFLAKNFAYPDNFVHVVLRKSVDVPR